MIIGIDCGHTASGSGSGAVGYLNESNETRNVGNALMAMLKQAGHTVVNCTNNKANSVSENLNSIINTANKQALDLFVSIHFNSGGGKGVEVFTYGGKILKEAENVCKNISLLGYANRGIKDGSNLAVVRKSKATAMLVEVCFVDSKSDSDLYKAIGSQAVARAIFKAITGEEVKESEDLTMTQYEELKKENQQLKAQIQALQPQIYNYMDSNMPNWARATIQKLMNKGILVGDEQGRLGLTMDMLKLFVVNDRAGLYN